MSIPRLKRELRNLKKNPPTNCSAGMKDGNLLHWIATIIGPSASPYSGGIYNLDVCFSTSYPFSAPKITFITKIFHPNISSKTGEICIDILKENWSPALTISKILLSICSLLTDPNTDDPLNVEAADLYIKNMLEYEITARRWRDLYA